MPIYSPNIDLVSTILTEAHVGRPLEHVGTLQHERSRMKLPKNFPTS